MRKHFVLIAAVLLLPLGSALRANPITIVGANRTGVLTDAVAGASGLGNPMASDIQAAFGGAWTSLGNYAGSGSTGGTNGMLTVTLTSGTWGAGNVTGTFTISNSFWATYGSAVISMHVGNGGGDPDFFAWTLTPGEVAGTWGYTINTGTGGGLSNIRLWGSGAPQTIPDGSSTIVLLGAALCGLSILRRRFAK